MRWMSMTSGRSFFRMAEVVGCVDWRKLVVDCRSLASGWAESSSESTDVSSEDAASSETSEAFCERLRFL